MIEDSQATTLAADEYDADFVNGTLALPVELDSTWLSALVSEPLIYASIAVLAIGLLGFFLAINCVRKIGRRNQVTRQQFESLPLVTAAVAAAAAAQLERTSGNYGHGRGRRTSDASTQCGNDENGDEPASNAAGSEPQSEKVATTQDLLLSEILEQASVESSAGATRNEKEVAGELATDGNQEAVIDDRNGTMSEEEEDGALDCGVEAGGSSSELAQRAYRKIHTCIDEYSTVQKLSLKRTQVALAWTSGPEDVEASHAVLVQQTALKRSLAVFVPTEDNARVSFVYDCVDLDGGKKTEPGQIV